MTKLVSRNPIQRFKEGRKIQRYWVGGAASPSYYDVGNWPKSPSGNSNSTARKSKATSNQSNSPSYWDQKRKEAEAQKRNNPTPTTYTGAVWDYLNSKAKNYGGWTTNNKGNQYFTITNNDGSKVNVFGNGQMYDMTGKLIGNISEQEVRSALQRGKNNGQSKQRAKVQRPQVEQPTQVQQPENFSYTVGQLTPNGQFKPSGFTTANPREAVKSTVAELNPQTPEYMDEPGRFSIGTALNSGNVRSNRNLYRNVDEYYDWLNTDAGANSDDYKLFANTGLWAPNISEENRRAAFNEMMNQYGISGNLGRRDSGRLANLLNNLSSLGNNSDMRGAFVDAYNNALDEASRTGSDGTVYSNSRVRDLFDKVVVNPAIRYGSSAQSWLSTPSNVSNASLGIKTPGNADYGTLLKYKFMPNRFNFYRNGGLIPRDPVDQFKIRKGASGFKAAFDAARAKGLATFSYKGNDYNTRKSGETEEQWARNVLKGRGNTVAGSRAQGRVHYKGQDAVVNERTGQVTKVNGGGFKIIDSKGKLVKGGFRTQAEADAYRKKNHITGLIKNEQKQTSMAYSDQSAKASGPTKVVGRGSNQGRTTTRKTNNNGTSITVGKSDPKPSGAVAQRKTRTGDNIKANEATSFINAADFFDAISPTTAITNGIAAGVNNLAGTEYKPFVAQFGLNPFGYAKDITEGNLGNLALRGIDTYALAGSPGLAEGTDWLLTKTAPRLKTVTSARYIPKGGVENGTLNKWNWNSLARGGNQATQSSFNKGVRGVTEGGRRSMQRAANEGMLHGFNGADKAAQWGTNFAQNANTGTTFFYRGAPTTYDVVADNAVRVAPWMVPAVDYSTQIVANQE